MKYTSKTFLKESVAVIKHLKVEDDDFNLDEIRFCENLESLHISKTNWRELDLSFLPQLSNLTQIVIAENPHLHGIKLPQLVNPSVISFHAYGNQLSEIPENLDCLEKLESINFKQNNISNLTQIEKLQHLKRVDVSSNKLEIIKEDIFNIQSLETLNLFDNVIEKINYNSSNKENQLNFLLLNKNKIRNFFYPKSKIKYLGLGDNQLVEVPNCIDGYPFLESLDLSRNFAIEEIPLWLAPTLKELRLSGLSHIKITSVSNLAHLNELDLSFCELDVFPVELIKLEYLDTLILNNNELDSIPKEINKFKSLEYLDLAGNNLKSLPVEIYDLKCLKKINLAYNFFPIDLGTEIQKAFEQLGVECIL